MASDKPVDTVLAELRRRAQERLELQDENVSQMSEDEIRRVLHELRTHQIELEIQNEDLRQAQTEIVASQKKYTELYDFAPIGYLSISEKGVIIEANHAASEILGVERRFLINNPFSSFLLPKGQDNHHICRKRLLKTKISQTCEKKMRRKDGSVFDVECRCTTNPELDGDVGQFRAMITDISKKKQEEEQLRQYEAIVASSSDLLALLDKEYKYLAVNQAYLDAFMVTTEELIGKTPLELFGEEFFNTAIKPNADQCLAGEEVRYGDWFDFPGHGHRYMEITYFPYYRDEKIIGFAVNGRDCTGQKVSEGRLDEANQNLREVVRAGRIGLWNWDLLTNKVTYSKEWKRQIGYKKHEIKDDYSEWEQRVHPDDLQPTLAIVNRNIKEKNLEHRVEFRFRHKDGSYRWILAQGSLILDEKGHPLKMMGSHVDITDSKEAEKEITRQKSLFESMFNTIPDGVVITDTERVIQLANKGMESTFGYKPEELLGKSTKMLYADLDKYQKTGESVFVEKADINKKLYITRYKDISGREFSGETFGTKLYDANGLWVGNLGIIRDITEREKAEQRIQQTQKMESIGTLAGGIAHDFNNILSAVLGYTELALGAVEKESPVADDLHEVYTAGLRAKELVAQILTFARQSDEELKPIQIDFIIKEVLKFLRSSIPTTIEIKQNIESDSRIRGNATQVHQILMNLCTNASHAMEDEGGTLEITLKDISIDRTTNQNRLKLKFGNYIELKVSDTGTGIESHVINKIFEPYFTTKKPGEGTGMGLALVHGIVEAYGGQMIVESTLGEGSVFTIYLPIAKGKSAPLSYKANELPTGQERILFVDDEAPIVKIASRLLGQLGYSVTTRTSSIDALELFKSNPSAFDLVISDVTMPQMTGDELTKKLIEIRPDIPVILCTGYSKRLSEEKGSEIGIQAFAGKPIVKEDLAKTVRDVLDLAKE